MFHPSLLSLLSQRPVSPLVKRALRELGVEPHVDRDVLAWRCACAAMERRFNNSYEENAARQIARSLLAGDDENAELMALWLVDPRAAMVRGVAAAALAPVAIAADQIEHVYREGCGCDECCATELELCAVADERRERWIEALENEPWPLGSALPWELWATPANDQFDVGEAA